MGSKVSKAKTSTQHIVSLEQATVLLNDGPNELIDEKTSLYQLERELAQAQAALNNLPEINDEYFSKIDNLSKSDAIYDKEEDVALNEDELAEVEKELRDLEIEIGDEDNELDNVEEGEELSDIVEYSEGGIKEKEDEEETLQIT
mmetsp:Transcript_11736/g.21088  ORF Transcript_11736/g.21088 Transcript_11736/m.21088 type:complete len:145 (-) Transcript_11736:274-708(-)